MMHICGFCLYRISPPAQQAGQIGFRMWIRIEATVAADVELTLSNSRAG